MKRGFTLLEVMLALAGELVISAGDPRGSTHNPAFATMGRN